MSKAEELIACLEGEIAKRDETIARLEPQLNRAIQANYDLREELAACRVAVENCDVFRARIAELESRYQRDVYGLNNEGDPIGGDPAGGYANDNARLRTELAAIKAQDTVGEVVGWYRLDRPYEMTSYPSVCATWHKLGTPVAPLYAAPAAPAADAWIQVSERLPDVPDGDEREVIVCVKRAHNGQSYSFSARYLNNFPLHSDSEDEPMIVTGWHDVKEHAEYGGWYSPLIDRSSGDEVTHWMPLPAAHRAQGVV